MQIIVRYNTARYNTNREIKQQLTVKYNVLSGYTLLCGNLSGKLTFTVVPAMDERRKINGS
jgi:hypothetical protein